jgi:hypothetical protein
MQRHLLIDLHVGIQRFLTMAQQWRIYIYIYINYTRVNVERPRKEIS